VPEWIYVAGRGHSGSTMLDAMLGNAPEIESVGELVSGMGRYEERCSCGETFDACPYWSAVRERFTARSGRAWDDAVSRSKGQAHIKAFPGTLFGAASKPWVTELLAITEAVGTAIADTAADVSQGSGSHSASETAVPPEHAPGAAASTDAAPSSDAGPNSEAPPRYVLDSSKEITRALFFLRFLPSSRVIHLMRHPVSILQSDYYRLKGGTGFKFLRRRYHPKRLFGPVLFVSVLTWITGNLLSDLARAFGRERFLRVRYEDIIGDPIGQIDRIEAFLGTPLGEVRERVRSGRSFSVGHNIGGNHMRLAGEFLFDPGKSRRGGLPVRFAVMAWLMTWPLLFAYGYGGRIVPPVPPAPPAPPTPGDS
jgi:hypothetical protein